MVAFFLMVVGICLSSGGLTLSSYSFRNCDKPNKLLCQNVFTANECGVMDSCIEIWHKNNWSRFTTDLSASCISCLAMNGDQQRQLLRDTCKILSPDYDEAECITLTEKLQFVNRLAKDGGVILCNLLSACVSHTYVGDLNFGVSRCLDSCDTVNMLDNMVLSPKRLGAVSDKLRTVLCRSVPEQYRQTCINNVNAHLPVISAMAKKQTPAESLCQSLKLCSQKDVPKNFNCSRTKTAYSWINRPTSRNSPKWTSYSGLHSQEPSCEDCIAVVDTVKAKLNDPKLQQEIKKAIEDTYCRNMRFLEEICENAVNTQFDKAIEHIVHSPSRPFCAAFGMCSPSGATRGTGPLIAAGNEQYTRLMVPLTNAIPVPGVCHVCEIVFEKLVELVIDEVTEERITAALDKVCKLIPAAYESQCDHLVKQYATQIVEAIVKGSAPKLACASMGLCLSRGRPSVDSDTSEASLEAIHFMGGVVRLLTSTQSLNIECTICRTMVSVLYPLLNDSAKMDEVKGHLEMLCTLLPSSYVDKCKNFVKNDFEILLDYIKNNVPEDKVCSLIGVCPAETSTLCSQNADFACSSLLSAVKCSAVQRCIGLGKGTNLVVVDKAICDQLSLPDTCASLELTHSCGKVEKCQLYRLAALLDSPSLGDTVSPDDKSDNCGLCIHMVDVMSLRRRLYGFSHFDHGSCQSTKTDKTCRAVIAKQKEVTNDIISGQFTSLQICKRHSLCGEPSDAGQTNNGHTADLDKSKSAIGSSCADGFTYWCSSMEAAVACNAVNYCKTFGYFDSSSNPTESDSESIVADQLGLDLCDFGATYWCQSRSTAERCGLSAVRHCETRVWLSQPAVTSSPQHLGQNPCTWGPNFWCANKRNAEMCNQLAYCQSIKLLV